MMKKNTYVQPLSFFLALLIFCLLLCTPCAALEQSSSFYVADYANVLSSSTENTIIDYNADIENNCDGAQMVFVLVDYIGNTPSDEYALQLMNDWGVGDADARNGMLLVASTQEKRGWLMQGEGIADSFTSTMCEEYLNTYFWPYFDNGDYDDAVLNLSEQLYSWYNSYYGTDEVPTDLPGVVPQAEEESFSLLGSIMNIIVTLVVLLVLATVLIVVLISVSGQPRFRRFHFGGWGIPFFFFPGRYRRPPPPPGGFPPGANMRPPRNTTHMGRGGGGFGSGLGGGRRGGFGGGMGRGGGGFGSGGGGGRR